jgi:hypothetical protein
MRVKAGKRAAKFEDKIERKTRRRRREREILSEKQVFQ